MIDWRGPEETVPMSAYTVTSMVLDLAPHELRANIATRAAKDEAEIDSMRTRGRYVGRVGEAVAVGGLRRADDVRAAGAKGAGKDKEKRKAKAETRMEARVPLGPPSAASRLLDRRGVNRAGASSLLLLPLPERVDRVCGEPVDEESAAVDEAVRANNGLPQGLCTAAMSQRFGEPRSSILRRSSAWRKRFSDGLRQFARLTTQRLFARC